ncbi:MAG: RtcB family protein [Bacteroidales bacterium]|nr:RtcB family protein [Bacteroidales bacterium]
MKKQKFTTSDFNSIGITELKWIKIFGKFAKSLLKQKKYKKDEILRIFKKIIENPESFYKNEHPFNDLANFIIEEKKAGKTGKAIYKSIDLFEKPIYYKIFGKHYIDKQALEQMDTAMRLPVTKAGALMPDAHVGYGLPIGGVLATQKNVVIPYAVGVDIACRMCMSIFDLPENHIEKEKNKLKNALILNTIFGIGEKTKNHFNNSLFDKPVWNATKAIKNLKDLAFSQLGTSGAGNHFVEWGILEITSNDKMINIPKGKYLSLLSHSGSRGFGAKIAKTYSDIAKQKTKLPGSAIHLAWLDINSEEGIEYWTAMNLAGEYASANHHEIHNKIYKYLGLKPLILLENHHNFAWKEKLADGTEVMVHRKGATPAGLNNIGIIPGSMTHNGFVVKGKANPESINSASHGAGRLLSRNQAFKNLTRKDLNKMVTEAGIELIGGDIDEAPVVYKNIDKVMAEQKSLVEILAVFTPRIVRMAEPEKRRFK